MNWRFSRGRCPHNPFFKTSFFAGISPHLFFKVLTRGRQHCRQCLFYGNEVFQAFFVRRFPTPLFMETLFSNLFYGGVAPRSFYENSVFKPFFVGIPPRLFSWKQSFPNLFMGALPHTLFMKTLFSNLFLWGRCPQASFLRGCRPRSPLCAAVRLVSE